MFREFAAVLTHPQKGSSEIGEVCSHTLQSQAEQLLSPEERRIAGPEGRVAVFRKDNQLLC